MRSSVFALVLFAISVSAVASEKHVVCYYGTWATYRHGLGQFNVENVNAALCTHLIYTFVGINDQGTVISLDRWLDLPDDFGRDNFAKFNALKQKNPKLKTILAVGGWNEGSRKYSVMVADPALRENFITSALQMILKHGFDGLDVDWEYPGRRDTVHGAADVGNFVTLLKELRAAFDQHGLLISAAVSAAESSASLSYDIPAMSKYFDLINLMAYDLYGSYSIETGYNAALHESDAYKDVPKENVYTVEIAVEYWLSQGCPPEKLILGVPFYGRTFTLANAADNGIRAPSTGAGIAGPFTVERGSIGYNEFCDLLRTQSWEVRYDKQAEVPYAIQGTNWVSFDDPNSITKKVEYALSKKLGGIMMWSIETDDFHGQCGEEFPLLKAINRALGKTVGDENESESSTSTSTTSTSTTTSTVVSTTESATTEASSEDPICKSIGFTSSPDDCSIFYLCITGFNGELIPKTFQCPPGLLWDKHISNCNYSHLVDC